MRISSLLEREPGLAAAANRVRTDPETPFPLLSVKIKLTWRCNLRCKVCSLWRKPAELRQTRDLLPPERVEAILARLKEEGLVKVHFSGGEVLLVDSFPRLLRFARKLGLQVNFTTNGTLLDKETARLLIEERIHAVTFSIDSGRERQHDEMRGVEGAFRRTLSGLSLLAERRAKKGRGPDIGVNTVITRKNVKHLDALYQLLRDHGVDRWRLLPVDSPDKRLRPTPSQWTDLAQKWEGHWRPLLARLPLDWSSPKSALLAGKGKYAGTFYSDRICFAPWFNLFIDANGLVYPCCMGKGSIPPYGNILESDLSEILACRRRQEIRSSMAMGHLFPVCKTCDDFLEENQAFANCLVKEE